MRQEIALAIAILFLFKIGHHKLEQYGWVEALVWYRCFQKKIFECCPLFRNSDIIISYKYRLQNISKLKSQGIVTFLFRAIKIYWVHSFLINQKSKYIFLAKFREAEISRYGYALVWTNLRSKHYLNHRSNGFLVPVRHEFILSWLVDLFLLIPFTCRQERW